MLAKAYSATPRGVDALFVTVEGDRMRAQQPSVSVVGLPDPAVREAKEETGLDVRLTRLVGVYSKPAQNALAVCFEAEVVGGSIQEATDEIVPVEFVAPESSYSHCTLPLPLSSTSAPML